MSKRGENIWHRKDGRWEARYIRCYNGNRAVYGYLYAKSYAEVKAKQQAVVNNLAVKVSTTSEISFKDLLEAFICQKKYHVKESTLSNYSYKMNTYLIPYWGESNLKEINLLSIDKFVDYLFASRHLAPKTVKDIAGLFDSILDFAYKNHFIEKKLKVPVPKISKRNVTILLPEDQEHLIRYLWENMGYGELGVLLSLMTGMRIGEICALKKNAFDFENCTVSVLYTLQRIRSNTENHTTKMILTSPKSENSMRTIPLPKSFSMWLQHFCSSMEGDDYIITGIKKYSEPRNYYKKYLRYLKECGLDKQGYTFHTLRHTFATEAIRRGIDAKSLSEILGHASVKITLEKYVHPSFEQKLQEMEKFMLCHPFQSYLQSSDAEQP